MAAAQGVDLLIHEIYAAAALVPEKRPGGEDWVRYMHTFHTSDAELAPLAERAAPKRLVLYHFVRMGASDEELVRGMRAGGYTGALSIAKDLDRY
jgi:ribonuclease Z